MSTADTEISPKFKRLLGNNGTSANLCLSVKA